MLRLFVGLPLPEGVRKILLSRMGGFPDVRWQDDRQLHLTLRFLGNVKENQATDIDLALKGLPFEPFELKLEGTGLFGTLRKPRLIWAGVDPLAPLVDLVRKMEAAVVRTGLPPETRNYTPHITIARCHQHSALINQFLDETADLTSPPWVVDHFVLFRSHLGHKAARYQEVSRYPATPKDPGRPAGPKNNV